MKAAKARLLLDVRPLNPTAWPDFADLVERHNGVWGGCWCMAFHDEGVNHWVVVKRVRKSTKAAR